MEIFKHKCDCGHCFDRAKSLYDHDEQYDVCPKCHDDCYTETPEYLLAENSNEVILVLQELQGCSVLPDYERGMLNRLLKKIK
jgi:hypothetical protein